MPDQQSRDQECPDCRGRGKVWAALWHKPRTVLIDCQRCKGTGKCDD